MDVFAHIAWTNVVFYKKYKTEMRARFIAVAFGVLPDLCSFAPVFIYSFFARQGFFELIGKNVWAVSYASESYNYTHSAVFFIATFLIVGILRKYVFKLKQFIYWPMFGWALHIFIDIFTHKNFYETPFLFPLSGFKFSHGISWGHPVFMIINYSALALVYLFWFLVLRKKKVI